MHYKRILLLFTALEILYLVFSFFYPLQTQTQFFKNIFFPPLKMQEDLSQAYNNKVLERIQSIRSSSVTSAILKNEYNGVIVNLQKDTQKNALYPIIFRLRGSNMLENTFLVTKQEFTIVQVFSKQNNENISSSINQLSEGNFVTIHEELDLLKPWPGTRQKFTIIIDK